MDAPLTVPGYELLARLAGAGDASVHRARERSSGRLCALSVLRIGEPAGDEERQLRFLEEGRALLAFKHPNVVRTFDVGSGLGICWIAQELVEGATLQELCDTTGGPLGVPAVLGVGAQVGRAIAALAAAGIVHRDVSASSVLLDRAGVARLGGFGLNFESSYERLSAGQAPLGSVDFLAPEQVEGELPPSSRTDVYGLGAALYRALAGRVPHAGATLFSRLRAIAHERPPDLRELDPRVPDAVAQLIARCMEWDPDDRPLPQDVGGAFDAVARRLGLEGEAWAEEAVAAALRRALPPTTPGPPAPPLGAPLVLRLRGTDRTIERTLRVGEAFEVGRSHETDVTLRFGWISRRHARLEREEGGVHLIDLGSANGTTLNGARVERPVRLEAGDLVGFGKSQFEVSYRDARRAPAAERQCLLCGQELAGEGGDDDESERVCLRCQARAEVDREAAAARIRLALEEAQFEVLARVGGPGLLKRYRVRRRARPFLASAAELGRRTARLFAEGSARALTLKHPGVLPTIDLQVHQGTLIVLHDDHPGDTLDERVARGGPLPPEDVVVLGVELCDAVDYLLGADAGCLLVRPDGVLLGSDGQGQLVDVGLAPGLVEASRGRGGAGPLPVYEAPEVAEVRDQDPRALVYALGATLSYALTGNPVAEVRGSERYDHLPLTLVPSVPAPLAEVLSQATAPRAGERQASPAELAAALRGLATLLDGEEQQDELEPDEQTTPLERGELPPEAFGKAR